jgi:hypothetical protein
VHLLCTFRTKEIFCNFLYRLEGFLRAAEEWVAWMGWFDRFVYDLYLTFWFLSDFLGILLNLCKFPSVSVYLLPINVVFFRDISSIFTLLSIGDLSGIWWRWKIVVIALGHLPFAICVAQFHPGLNSKFLSVFVLIYALLTFLRRCSLQQDSDMLSPISIFQYSFDIFCSC